MGDEMEWFNDTERLTPKPEWIEYMSSQAQGIIFRISQGAVCLQYFAEHGCTKRVQRNTGRYLVFCILVLSLFLVILNG